MDAPANGLLICNYVLLRDPTDFFAFQRENLAFCHCGGELFSYDETSTYIHPEYLIINKLQYVWLIVVSTDMVPQLRSSPLDFSIFL